MLTLYKYLFILKWFFPLCFHSCAYVFLLLTENDKMSWMLLAPLKLRLWSSEPKLEKFVRNVSWVIVLMCWMEWECSFFPDTHTRPNGSITVEKDSWKGKTHWSWLSGLWFLLLLFIATWKIIFQVKLERSRQNCQQKLTVKADILVELVSLSVCQGKIRYG